MTASEQMTDASAETEPGPGPEAKTGGRSRRRGPWLIAGACAAVVAVAGTTLVLTAPRSTAAEDTIGSNLADAPLEKVSRGDLTERVRLSGRLAYEGTHDLGSSLPGTVTGMPAVGTMVDRGGELFRIDDRPVSLLFGGLPMWRAFGPGMEDGADVKQLEENLAALGYFAREPDEEFAWSTAAAIEEWQEDLGLEETGTIELGRIAFASGPLRISAQKTSVGDPASGSIVSVSGTEKRVTAYLDPDQREIAQVGTKVRLSLPGGVVTEGTVTTVGAVAEHDDGDGKKELKLPVTIALDDPATADGLDNVGVSGELTAVKRADALLVPVVALLATAGGGHAVEVVSGGESKLVPVELGAFADGFVEVTGGGLTSGDRVVVAK